jgi:hypothetical protein
MTIEQTHTEIRNLLDKSYNGAMPEVEPLEIDMFLNNSMGQFISNRYDINNIYREGFEQSIKRTDDLRYLIRTSYIPTTFITNENNLLYANVDFNNFYEDVALSTRSNNKYLHFVNVSCKVTTSIIDSCDVSTSKTGYPTIKIIRHEEFVKSINDPFNKPSLSNILGMFNNKGIQLVSPVVTYNWIKLVYLKTPNLIRYIETPTILNNASLLQTYTLYEVVTTTVFGGRTYNVGEVFNTETASSITSGTIRLFTGIELPEYAQRELVKITVENMLEALESPRLQTLSAENNKLE